jgi:PHD/YefM family antitoxin component YafN of YafNO toxin-antitoxin module
MQIKPSAAIRKNYNEISSLCRKTGEPVFLTKHGEGDLVVLDIGSYLRREAMLKLRETLVSAEEDRLAGKKGYTAAQVSEQMKKAVREVVGAKAD